MRAGLKRQGDGAAVGFNQVRVDLGLEMTGQFCPAVFGAGHGEEDLAGEQAASVVVRVHLRGFAWRVEDAVGELFHLVRYGDLGIAALSMRQSVGSKLHAYKFPKRYFFIFFVSRFYFDWLFINLVADFISNKNIFY